MSVRMLMLLALLGSVVGCERAEQPAIPALPELPGNPGVAPARVNGSVGAPEATPPAQISYGAAGDVAVSRGVSGGEGGGDVSLDFADTDIREVVAQILGNMLKVNYTIDPAVHGSATLRTVTPLSRAQLLPTLESLLAQNGAAIVQSGSLYRVVPANQAASAFGSDGTAGTVVAQLHYASAEDLAKVLQPYVGEGGKIVADAGRNALLISGDPSARASLLGLVQTFDTDILGRQSYALLPVSVGDVKDFASALQDAMRGQSGGALAGMVRVVPLTRINAVLVVSPQSRYIDQARRVYVLIDRARQQTVRSWHVYICKTATPRTSPMSCNRRSRQAMSRHNRRVSRLARNAWPMRLADLAIGSVPVPVAVAACKRVMAAAVAWVASVPAASAAVPWPRRHRGAAHPH